MAAWQQANACYNAKQYDSARSLYLEILTVQPQNATILYNLGNTYYRLNDIPNAVLYYQKSLRVDPGNAKAKQNLALAQGRIQNALPEITPIFFVRWWQSLTRSVHTNTWAIGALLFFSLTLFAVYLGRTQRLKYYMRHMAAAIVLCIVCLLATLVSYHNYNYHTECVVMRSNTTLLQAPQAAAKVLGSIPAGSTLVINDKKQSYLQVALSNGNTGWVAADAVTAI